MDEQLMPIVDGFKGKKILVVGDLMLDRHMEGSVSRISPEAPVQVMHVTEHSDTPGGAANVLLNLSALDAEAIAVGAVGDDIHGLKLKELLTNLQVDVSGVITDVMQPTIVKKKLFSKGYQLLRLDYEDTTPVKENIEEQMLDFVKSKMPEIDAIIISDYAKGTITKSLAYGITNLATENRKPVIVDAKPKTFSYYKKCALITLNLGEASKLSKIKVPSDDDANAYENTIIEIGKMLLKESQSSIMITCGNKGMYLFQYGPETALMDFISAEKVEIADVIGVGDTVTAVLASAIATDASLLNAAKIANYAGSFSVSRKGKSFVTVPNLRNIFRTYISNHLRESIRVKEKVINEQLPVIESIVKLIIEAYKNKKKVLIFGNGGSAGDAQHFAAELVGRYKLERISLPAIALTTDTSAITAIGNDYGYDAVFERQVEGLAQPGDVLIGISTSGNSPNVIRAIEKGKAIGLKTVALLGKSGGKLKEMCNYSIVVPSENTPRIQESHITIIHIICEILENTLFK